MTVALLDPPSCVDHVFNRRLDPFVGMPMHRPSEGVEIVIHAVELAQQQRDVSSWIHSVTDNLCPEVLVAEGEAETEADEGDAGELLEAELDGRAGQGAPGGSGGEDDDREPEHALEVVDQCE